MISVPHAAFIADAHLRGGGSATEEEKAARLHNFLAQAAPCFAMLCICGDLFDFWFEYRRVVVNRYFRTLCALSELVRSGTEVHYVAGNHDFWMRDFLTREVGVTVHPQDFQATVAGQRVFVSHGDGLYTKDRGYRLLKRVLQNRIATALYRAVHPDVGVPIAEFFSELSRNHGAQREFSAHEDYRAFAQQTLRQGFDVVVLAHTHEPVCQQLDGGVYLNPGDWIRHFSFGVIDQGGIWLKRWSAEQGAVDVAQVALPVAAP
ncbi:MAG: UDP-2,3-diacylglucosamine diphosphatase [bacterium]|jgi:UDP-2,3-diacylglucosamine hydrolase|nr:UDP-2,3-diacylglucosamine diphosphatase [candidate division KSB1 bacterium]MDH7560662.1 UDP-2,3-diacylglucosamine diphosphatase [bacterium]